MADSQRKTANLFDATAVSKGRINSSTGAIEYAEDTPTLTYSDTNNEFTITTRYAWRGFVTEYLDIQEKPSFSYVSDDGLFYSFQYAYDENKNYLGSVSASDVPVGTKYIRVSIQCSAVVTNAKIKNIMLNSGETPLPYEPYGWVHSLRKLGTSTDTLTTLPADLYADGTNATVGLVGNMSQTGTPTPQNPIQPQECGERTAQLYFKKIANGSIGADGSIVSNASFDCYVAKVEANKEYIGTGYVYAFYTSEPTLGSTSYNGQRVAESATNGFTSPIDGYVAVRHNAGVTDARLNTGSTIKPYEPYGYKLDITSANTTTPVYLGEVESTRKIKKYECKGDENIIVLDLNNHIYGLRGALNTNPELLQVGGYCTHYSYNNAVSSLVSNMQDGDFVLNKIIDDYSITVKDDARSTSEDFKRYLANQYAAGTPVCVWYVLATPQTAVVNEPIRKIGDYADTVSVTNIPTTTGKDTFDVLTTLKPSEVSLTYTGWHDATVKEWDGSEWQ